MCYVLTREQTENAKKFRGRYQSLSKEKQGKKQHYGRERYKNISGDEKQRFVEYKKYYKMK